MLTRNEIEKEINTFAAQHYIDAYIRSQVSFEDTFVYMYYTIKELVNRITKMFDIYWSNPMKEAFVVKKVASIFVVTYPNLGVNNPGYYYEIYVRTGWEIYGLCLVNTCLNIQ